MTYQTDAKQQSLAVLGQAYRKHQVNQTRILESAERVCGRELPQLLETRRAMAEMAKIPDWQLGATIIHMLLEGGEATEIFPGITLQ